MSYEDFVDHVVLALRDRSLYKARYSDGSLRRKISGRATGCRSATPPTRIDPRGAESRRLEELHVELNGGLNTGGIALSGSLAHCPIRQRHQHPAMDIAGAVGLGMKAESSVPFRYGLMKDRTDELNETVVFFPTQSILVLTGRFPQRNDATTSAPASIAIINPITHPIAASWFSQ
ncbi:UNVERIFIED_ORG: hypothetical protein GGD48_005561 [Rhizobium etli]